MIIRYFAQTDDSPNGAVALEYLKSLLRIGQVRLISRGALDGRWKPYAPLFTTPMADGFVNAVCCPVSMWSWIHRVPAPRVQDGQIVADTVVGRCELYTQGVRNVLLAFARPDPICHEAALATALRYQAIVTPDSDGVEAWARMDGRAVHIPVPVTDHALLQSVIVPNETNLRDGAPR